MPRFTSDDIARVREATDLVALVSETVELHQKGRVMWGCCPFHAEATPSFKVDPERQQWYCFGEGEGGDAIDFAMKRDGLSFTETVEMLAERAHVELPPAAAPGKGRRSRRDPLAGAREAASAAEKLLTEKLEQAPEGDVLDAALAALGHDRASASKRGLGYIPPAMSTKTVLGNLGYSAEALAAAGVDQHLTAGVNTGKVVLPIRDAGGRPVAFAAADAPALASGRGLCATGPATALFNRSSAVYGLDRARRGMVNRGLAVVVDNPATAELLAAKGADNVVATLGCPLTPAHAELIGSMAPTIAYLFDGTPTGQRAEDFAARLVDWGAVGEAAGGHMIACTAHMPGGATVAAAARETDNPQVALMTAIATGSTVRTGAAGREEASRDSGERAERDPAPKLGSLDDAVAAGKGQLAAQGAGKEEAEASRNRESQGR